MWARCSPAWKSYEVSDVFGFFKREHKPDMAGQELLVLPVPFDVEPLTFAAGDMGVETMRRAMEDPSSPNDFRAYQQGDPLKRIHWKMSARKRELFVKQFEEPALPDALVMLDTSPPQLAEGLPDDQSAFFRRTRCWRPPPAWWPARSARTTPCACPWWATAPWSIPAAWACRCCWWSSPEGPA